MVSRLVRVQEAVGSNPATPTKNPQIFVQQAQKSEDFSFAKPGDLCVTPKPGNAEKADHRTDYLAETLTRKQRRKGRQRGFGLCCLIPIIYLFREIYSSPLLMILFSLITVSQYLTTAKSAIFLQENLFSCKNYAIIFIAKDDYDLDVNPYSSMIALPRQA